MVDMLEMPPLKKAYKGFNFKKLYLFISPAPHQLQDCQLESVLIEHSNLQSAMLRLNMGANFPDVVIFQNLSEENIGLIEFLKKKGIPAILYSNKFQPKLREKARMYQMDDYLCGAINDDFIAHVDFLKELKELRNNNEASPSFALKQEELPKPKLWSLKRTFDVVISFSILLLLLPLMVVIAIIVKLESKGSIFYIAKRSGTCYSVFSFYKFRTMRQGAANELADLAKENQYGNTGENAVFFKIKNDPRVTAFGQFLRKTSLDELPQLINVLKGDMSLVGNRPLPLYEAEKLTRDNIAWRFLAPAGITGLWQVTKRGKENMSPEERIQLDMEYAMKNSFTYDMKILFMTIPALLQKERV
jgi:lipopolysaccharide/colanic/teichoic acid biosynthesis glycosyltransferase